MSLFEVYLGLEINSGMNGIPKCEIQMKATEQYFSVVLFNVLYKVILTYESVDNIP